jgi:tRNA nucleotidyltransferase (CCA-adding enzyme)
VTDAVVTAQRYGHSGICVREEGRVVGIVARRDLDKAIRHGLGHAPVKGVMTRSIVFASSSTTVDELRRIIVAGNAGRVPVVTDEAYEDAQKARSARVSDVLGIVTRTDVLAAYQGRWEEEQSEVAAPQLYSLQALAEHPFFGRLFRACSALSEDFAGVYLVGGFVRDLLLDQPNADVDVATTRTEFYDHPAALPRVEHASIRQDLFRRDFTINAMAVSLHGEDLGTVIDFFGGFRDLREGVIRVLHNLSFIEDPTRIFRAVRYENRYGFRMDEQTKSFAKSCVDMHLVGDLSSVRLRDELVALLGEGDVGWTLGRLFELGVAREVHPKLATGTRTIALVKALDGLIAELGLEGEVVTWRLRLAAVTRNMTHDELYLWLDRLKLRGADSRAVRAAVVLGPLLASRLDKTDMRDWDVYKALRGLPLEAVVFALAGMDQGIVKERLRRYITDIRHRTIAVTGDDLLTMGMKKGPAVGRILDKLKELRVEGVVSGRAAELETARRLVEKAL